MSYPSGPQQPHHGPPPPFQPPKPGMSTGKKVGLGVGLGCGIPVLLLIMMVGCVAVVSSPSSESTSSSEPTAEPTEEVEEAAVEDAEEAHPGLGDVIEHGDWEITVESIAYDVDTADLDEFFADEPSGQWVTVHMSVKNVSSSPQYFSGNDQVLMDSSGSMYTYDIWASDLSGDDLNPGTEASGFLAYDVPTDFEADHMLVNGETFLDDGVRVDLD